MMAPHRMYMKRMVILQNKFNGIVMVKFRIRVGYGFLQAAVTLHITEDTHTAFITGGHEVGSSNLPAPTDRKDKEYKELWNCTAFPIAPFFLP